MSRFPRLDEIGFDDPRTLAVAGPRPPRLDPSESPEGLTIEGRYDAADLAPCTHL